MNNQQFNNRDLNIWLATNDMNKRKLAERLKITPATISNYCLNDRFPTVFVLALGGIAASNNHTN